MTENMNADRTRDEASVRAMLDAAGLQAGDDAVQRLVASHANLRAAIEAVWAVGETRYVSPALIFRADAPASEW
ncbi:MAG TPA: hypothetical protein VMU94_21740 [Streptosporangiaceae bacterium]|nr:hypothetical protein [Streptosporangiaceae bacterium]